MNVRFLALLVCIATMFGSATAQAVDRFLIWGDAIGKTIRRANTDGTNGSTILTRSQGVSGAAVTPAGDKMYWAELNGKLYSANIDGSNVTLINPSVGYVYCLLVDDRNSKLYWADYSGGTINRSNLDGSSVETLQSGLGYPYNIALDLDNEHVYYTESHPGKLGRVNFNGTGNVTLQTINRLYGLSLDLDHSALYYTTDSPAVLYKSDLDGNNAVAITTSGISDPYGIVFDPVEAKVYLGDPHSEVVKRVDADGTNVTTIVTGAGYLLSLSSTFAAGPAPTATATATATWTPTSTPTSTATPVPTETATSVPTHGATPTQVPPGTPTPDPTPLPPVASPSPTPSLPVSELSGRVIDANGQPVAGMIVYAFKQNAAALAKAKTKASAEQGMLSALTDASGFYLFKDLTAGTYRIIPDYTGVSFSPSQVVVANGIYAPDIQAVPTNLHDVGCEVSNKAEAITTADGKSQALLSFGLGRVEAYRRLANKKLDGRSKKALLGALQQASERMQAAYTSVLTKSLGLPKVVLNCNGKATCSSKSFTKTVKGYRYQVDELRRLAFFVLRKSREQLRTNEGPEGSLSRKTRKLHRDARKLSKELPTTTDECTA